MNSTKPPSENHAAAAGTPRSPRWAACRQIAMASVRPCAGAKCPDRRHDRSRYRFRRSKQPSRRNSEKERSEEHTSELQSLMRISYAVFSVKKKKEHINNKN